MTDTSGYDSSSDGSGDSSDADLTPVSPAPAIDTSQILQGLTSVPVFNTLTSSIFDQAQKPEVDADGKVKKPPVGQNIDDLMAFGAKIQNQMQGIVGAAQAISDKNNQIALDTQKAIKDSGAQDAIILDIKAAQQMKTQKDNAAFAGSIGVDPNQASYTLLQEGEKLRQQRLALDNLGQEAQKEASASLFSDPGAFLLRSITGPTAQRSYAVAVERYKAGVDAIRQAEDVTGDVAVRNAALDQVTTSVGVAALQQKAADDITEKANASKQDALKFKLSAISPILQATSEQFHTAQAVNNAMVQQQSLQLEKEGLDFRRADAEFTNLKKQEQIMLLNDTVEGRQQKQADLTRMNAAMGTNVSLQDYLHMGDKERQAVDNLSTSVKYTGTAGPSPASAIEHLNDVPAAPNIGLDQTKSILEDVMNRGRELNSAKGAGVPYRSMSPVERLALDNTSITTYSKTLLASGIPDTASIYSLPSLSKMLAMPQVAGTELAQSLIPQASNPNYETKATDIVTHASDLVNKGVPLSKVAKQVSDLYTAGMLQNNVTNQYNKLNVQQLDPIVTGYKVNIPGIGVTDMSNPTKVAQAISRSILKAKTRQYLTPEFTPGTGTAPGVIAP